MGKSKDSFLTKCLREICFLCATLGFEVRSVHLPGEQNRLSDSLSRWHLGIEYQVNFYADTTSYNLREWEVTDTYFQFDNKW
jgi:hypothetical protein